MFLERRWKYKNILPEQIHPEIWCFVNVGVWCIMDSLETFTREEKQNIILNLSSLHESSFWLSRELKESQCLSFDNHNNHVTLVISCLEHSFLLFHLSGLDFQVNRSNMSQLVFSSLSALSFTTLSILCEQTEPEIMRLVSFMFFL